MGFLRWWPELCSFWIAGKSWLEVAYKKSTKDDALIHQVFLFGVPASSSQLYLLRAFSGGKKKAWPISRFGEFRAPDRVWQQAAMELERRPISVLVPVVPVRISEFAIRTLIPTEEEVRSATLSPIPSGWVLSVGHVENRKKTPKNET
jgi:hypothetical protein